MKILLSLRSAAAIATCSFSFGYFFGKHSPPNLKQFWGETRFSDPFQHLLDLDLSNSHLQAKSVVRNPSNVPTHVNHEKILATTTGEIVKYGFPSTANLRSYDDFILSYDPRNKVANWVLEHLTSDKVTPVDGVERSKMKFSEDESIHFFHRATNKDFQGSGYDKGHLAAAANHRQSEKAMHQTFLLSNVAPQVGVGFNRDAWNNLEKYVRALARKHNNVYVCTGPLYLPQRESDGKMYVKFEVLGNNHVSVPTHFFKVVLTETENGQFDLQSFVMPNQPQPAETKLHDYLVPLNVIERSAGLHFFQNIPQNSFRRINAKTAVTT